MELSQKITVLRKKRGLTQEELAESAGVTVRTIQRIESGESRPRPYTLKAIALALHSSFEELNQPPHEQDSQPTPIENIAGGESEENEKHFLQMLCLSCFSYLVVPFVHFLIPGYLLKKSGEKNPQVLAFAKRMIRVQLYWKSALWFFMLMTLAYNLTMAYYFERSYLLNYLWPFFIMYILNAILITADLLRIRARGASYRLSV